MARSKRQARVAETVAPPRVGAFSNLFRGKPADVASLFVRYGLESVQIQPRWNLGITEQGTGLDLNECREISQPFADAGIMIAGLTASTNFVDPQITRRRRLVRRFDAMIEHCQDFGTNYIITETGTLDPEHPWSDFRDNRSPATLALFRRNLTPSVRLAEKNGVTILLKGYLYHVVHNMEIARSIHEHFGPTVRFVMDPASYFTRNMVSASTSFLRRLFEVMGEFCPIAHGKDVRYVGGTLTTPRTGTGGLDYREYLELLDEYNPDGALILEQIGPEQLRETLDFLDRFFE
jgi:sugar phosphate isomerase/epimerase